MTVKREDVKPDWYAEFGRLETWLKLIRDRARGMAAAHGGPDNDFARIANWAEAALKGEHR